MRYWSEMNVLCIAQIFCPETVTQRLILCWREGWHLISPVFQVCAGRREPHYHATNLNAMGANASCIDSRCTFLPEEKWGGLFQKVHLSTHLLPLFSFFSPCVITSKEKTNLKWDLPIFFLSFPPSPQLRWWVKVAKHFWEREREREREKDVWSTNRIVW